MDSVDSVEPAGLENRLASAARLASFRRSRPADVGRGAKVHPALDALWDVLDAASVLERASLRALSESLFATRAGDDDAADNRRRATTLALEAQSWRLHLARVFSETPAAAFVHDPGSGAPPDAAVLERVASAYALTRRAIRAAADATRRAGAGDLVRGGEKRSKKGPKAKDAAHPHVPLPTPAKAWARWARATEAMDAALGAPPGEPPAPLLWRARDRPRCRNTPPPRRRRRGRGRCARR